MIVKETREDRIAKYSAIVKEDPDNSNARGRLRDNLNSWYENDVQVTVQVANNEQLPWTLAEIGLPLEPMLTKKTTSRSQVGDYNFTVIYKDRATTGGLVGERKSFSDLLGTLSDHEHYINLMQEVERFNVDDRFSIFKIYAECSKPEFMNWKPPEVVHYIKKAKDEEYVRKNEAKRLKDWQAVMRGKIAVLQARGASISWEGSRQEAALQFNNDVRHWCLKNYEKIIGVCE